MRDTASGELAERMFYGIMASYSTILLGASVQKKCAPIYDSLDTAVWNSIAALCKRNERERSFLHYEMTFSWGV